MTIEEFKKMKWEFEAEITSFIQERIDKLIESGVNVIQSVNIRMEDKTNGFYKKPVVTSVNFDVRL